MSTNRRQFLTTGAMAAVGLIAPWGRRGALVRWSGMLPGALPDRMFDDPLVKTCAMRALDAATHAGASYADVHLSRDLGRRLLSAPGAAPMDARQEALFGFGVRTLVDGQWGFASSPLWTADEADRLARAAVAQAKANRIASAPPLELDAPPPAATGTWIMPVAADPFTVSFEEQFDYLDSLVDIMEHLRLRGAPTPWHLKGIGMFAMGFIANKKERAFASSLGAYTEQTTYQCEGQAAIKVDGWNDQSAQVGADRLSVAGKGWEMMREANVPEQLPGMIERAILMFNQVPVELGRYDVVFDAKSMAAILDATLGTATELDRAIGYEANAAGTSFLTDPLAMLGSLQVAAPTIGITANRSTPGGAANVKWDTDGVAPESFPLVQDGVVVGFQTTRETAPVLAPWDAKRGQPVRSNGCASAADALHVPIQHTPNLALQPGKADLTFDEMVAGTEKGLAIYGASVMMDHQQVTGLGVGTYVRRIEKGKLGPMIAGAAFQFRTAELWKNITALGGARSVELLGFRRKKGQPEQEMVHSVAAVPAKVKQVAIVDLRKKA
ncbi:MAG TPA: metallopeptidase TldD-related protein [Gemmatimonadaceae bacterium]|jgi:TldD protein|nr:metallopeptidase TldD-related protein [Gemmatimonadaceae bacterium]